MLQVLVNPLFMMENAGHDATLARELADVFVESSVDLSLELRQALADDDWKTVARAAHSFKSPLGFFGAEKSVEIAQSLESQVDAGQTDNAQELVDRLLSNVEQVKSELVQTDFNHLNPTQ